MRAQNTYEIRTHIIGTGLSVSLFWYTIGYPPATSAHEQEKLPRTSTVGVTSLRPLGIHQCIQLIGVTQIVNHLSFPPGSSEASK